MKKRPEIWCEVKYKNIKPDMYEVSNYGGLRNIKTGKKLHPWIGKNGYMYCTFMCNDNTVISIGMHVIVAKHFLEVPKELQNIDEPIVPNHNDFDRSNNYVGNLTWMTYAQNNEYNRINGHWKICEDAPNSKVENALVHKICQFMEDGYKNIQIIKRLDLDNNSYFKSLLTRIRTGKQWKEISSQYNINNKNTLRNTDIEYIDSICQMIEKGYSLKQMRANLGIPDTAIYKRRFKSLVYGIRMRKNYKDISDKYTWWK